MGLAIDFTGRTVVVTGGTRGIGAALGDAFEAAGAHRVILTGTSDVVGDLTVEEKRWGSKSMIYRQVDFANENSTQDFLAFIRGFDRIDVCVNNAGVNRIRPIEEVDASDFDWLTNINLRAPLLVCGAVAPTMKQQGYGRIVNIASIWGSISKPGRSLYTASKFGLVGLTKTVAIELAQFGVLANAVSPGFTMTELTRKSLSEEEIAQLSQQLPIRRFAMPTDIANVVLFLASDLNTYLTGQNITVDGGFVSI